MSRLSKPIGYTYIVIAIVVLALIAFSYWYFGPFEDSITLNMAQSVLSSFIGGLILASIFFFLLRPNVKISPYICETRDRENNKCYKFKFINHSLFAAFDVKIEAYLCKEINATANGEGVNRDLVPIKLTRTEWMHMPKWRKTNKKTRYAHHCNTVRTYHPNLPDEITDNAAYVIFRVTLKHAFSNLSSTFRMKYPSEKNVKIGQFKFGNNLNIQ